MAKSKIRLIAEEFIDKALIFNSHRCEINKYKDKRRKKIYSSVKLTKQQKNDIDTFFIKNYGKKIPYTWHRHYTAFTGKFDVKYFPELLYIPEFEYFMNYNKEYRKVFSDKNVIPLIAKNAGIKTPEIILSCTKGIYRDSNYNILKKQNVITLFNNIGEVFVKPSVNSSSGRGCFIANIQNGEDIITKKMAIDIIDSLGDDFVIQRKLLCHETLRQIYPYSVNTFRIITYRWKEEIRNLPVIMRFGRGGSYLDNAHAGGAFIGVNNEGILLSKAYTEFKEEFSEHPDTHVVFKNYEIIGFEEMVRAAKRMHELVPQIGCVNWDFTIDKDGYPILIEANMNGGSIWLIQMAHGEGAFEEHTAEILSWIKYMKNKPKKEKEKYSYGRF